MIGYLPILLSAKYPLYHQWTFLCSLPSTEITDFLYESKHIHKVYYIYSIMIIIMQEGENGTSYCLGQPHSVF